MDKSWAMSNELHWNLLISVGWNAQAAGKITILNNSNHLVKYIVSSQDFPICSAQN